ncbi:MAG: putative iron-sulfur flavoprotein [Clostridiaceae bacterium]|jgi:multimeric flavodoxin WrbA|nr:putative iron-sulfur flavoprotein [Clostridiaceae bacterium]
MKVIGICGSPREESNTKTYINYTLKELKNMGFETELITLRDKKIEECTGCYGCVKAKHCIIEDDFQEIFQKMLDSDGILIGSPVYNSSITAKLKGLLDRAGFTGRWIANNMKNESDSYQWNGTAFSGKVAAPITVARRAGQNFAFAQLLLWMTVNDFIVTGSHYWNVGVAGTSGKLDAENDEEGLIIMKHLAQNMAHVITQLKK